MLLERMPKRQGQLDAQLWPQGAAQPPEQYQQAAERPVARQPRAQPWRKPVRRSSRQSPDWPAQERRRAP
jgi:hypothetical protein